MLKKLIAVACFVSLHFSSAVVAESEKVEQCVPEGAWVTSNGKSYDAAEISHSLSKTQVVLLGEDHDNPEHHRWQLQTMSAIYALQPKMALGFEAFPRSTQKTLDRWVAGELSEKEFLADVDWNKIWRFNKDDYMPMFHFARMNRIPLYALNVHRSLVSQVADVGWEQVPAKKREGVSKPAEPLQDYIDVLAQVFSQHMPKHAHNEDVEVPELSDDDMNEILGKASFQRFLQSQLLWDRAMAEKLYEAVNVKKHPVVVGVIGAGHIMGDYGVPYQLNSLGLSSIKTLMPWDGTNECQQLRDGAVDIAFGIVKIDRDELEAEQDRPRLGIYLEHNEGVIVSRLVQGSVAEKTGMKTGDKLLIVAGKKIEKVSEVIDAVQATAFGTWLPMTVKRGTEIIELVAKFPAKP